MVLALGLCSMLEMEIFPAYDVSYTICRRQGHSGQALSSVVVSRCCRVPPPHSP